MAASASSLDYWRKLFRSSSSDIFQVIENAIEVAAFDRPEDFLSHRDRIAERLFTCHLDRCGGCNRILESEDRGEGDGEEEEEEEEEEKSKVDSSNGSGGREPVSNYSYGEAEALTEEIEEESQIVGEVLRIKEILSNHKELSDGVLFESLRRLQLMALSVETLKATEIGRAVNRLKKHNSNQIRNFVRTLIDGWKLLVDEWVNTAPVIPDNATPDSVNPSVLDEEEGLPFPPLDEGALFATQTTAIQLSEFFDGMDDDGNLRNEGEFDKKRDSGRRPSENQKPVRKQDSPYIPQPVEQRRQEPIFRQSKDSKPRLVEAPTGQSKPQGNIKNKVSNTDSGSCRQARLASEQHKHSSHMNYGVQKKSIIAPQDRVKNSEDTSVRARLEVAKRKLQEGYQQAETAKKQRTIQVMELQDLPRQGSNMKHKSNIRNRASARR